MSFLPRVIPLLLLDHQKLVKTLRFDDPVYVGDPVNILSIFSSFEVDEIVLLDIDAPRSGRGPDVELLGHLASEALVPLTYGGGIRTIGDVRQVLAAGVEKVAVNTALADGPEVIGAGAALAGNQAIVASIDVRRSLGPDRFEVCVAGGSRPVTRDLAGYAQRAQSLGAGEILLTAVDRDGTREGYDLELVQTVAQAVTIPVIAAGGAGSRRDLAAPLRAGASAVAAGSMFVFQKQRGSVLVNFPNRAQIEALFA